METRLPERLVVMQSRGSQAILVLIGTSSEIPLCLPFNFYLQKKQSFLDEGVCNRHREGIIEVCVQPGCADLLCNKCKTTTHKDHHTMELSDYKELCLTEFGNYQNCLQRYNTDLEKLLQETDVSFVPLKKIKVEGEQGECRPPLENADEEDPQLQLVIKQTERVQRGFGLH